MAKRPSYGVGPIIYPSTGRRYSADRMIASGWSVVRRDGRFFFEFTSASHGGKMISHEISEIDFDGAWDGTLDFEDLVRNYDQGRG